MVSLGTLHALASTTEERLKSLNALAEHVSVKTKALETQRVTIDHAAAEASRLNEMVWAREAQIGKLEDGNRQVGRAEQVLRQAEELAAKVQDELDAATARARLVHEGDRENREGRRTTDSGGAGADEALGNRREEFNANEQRIADLQEGSSRCRRSARSGARTSGGGEHARSEAEALGEDLGSSSLLSWLECHGGVPTWTRWGNALRAWRRRPAKRRRGGPLESGRALHELRAEFEAIHIASGAREPAQPAHRRSGSPRNGRRQHHTFFSSRHRPSSSESTPPSIEVPVSSTRPIASRSA